MQMSSARIHHYLEDCQLYRQTITSKTYLQVQIFPDLFSDILTENSSLQASTGN